MKIKYQISIPPFRIFIKEKDNYPTISGDITVLNGDEKVFYAKFDNVMQLYQKRKDALQSCKAMAAVLKSLPKND